jgi:hypothetical protein
MHMRGHADRFEALREQKESLENEIKKYEKRVAQLEEAIAVCIWVNPSLFTCKAIIYASTSACIYIAG